MYFTNMRKFISYILLWMFCIIWISIMWWNVYAGCRTVRYDCESKFWDISCKTKTVCDEDEEKKADDNKWWKCDWIKLNTKFPIIWNCIETKGNINPTNAFPTMLWAITKIIMSIILVVCFIMIIWAGILWASDNPKDAKPLFKKVAITLLLLWLSWVILKLVNPNFFV